MNEDLINDKLQLAKLYFKSKKYQNALSTYTELLELVNLYTPSQLIKLQKLYGLPEQPLIGKLHHPKLSSILDARAATFEKLGDVQKSLNDSERSLLFNPIDLKAYLRIGKNHLKLGDEIKAFRQYQTGYYLITKFLEKHPQAPVNQEYLTKLKSSYGQLNSHLKRKRQDNDKTKRTRKILDPFIYLDYDVIQIILGFLSQSLLLKCHLVCKKWYTTMVSFTHLYRRIELKLRIKHKEFTNGISFFKKVGNEKLSIRINATTSTDFWKVTENIIKLNLCIENLEVFNVLHYREWLQKHDKYAFKFKYGDIRKLKLLLLSSPPLELLFLFNKLEHLELLIMDNQAANMPRFQHQIAYEKCLKQTPTNLESLVLINSNKITNYPPFLLHNLNLTKLIVSNFDFSTIVHEFGSFISHCTNLKYLTLENNRGISLKLFLQNLINYRSDFKLLKFVFREFFIDNSLNLNEFNATDFHNFNELVYLDVYSTSLSNNGLLRFLSFCPGLETLVLGSSNYIHFRNREVNQFIKLNLIELLKKVPNLRSLAIVDLNLDNLSLTHFGRDFKQLQFKLDYLDVSFNQIDGVGLLSLLDYDLGLKYLILDGIHVNSDTLRLIQSKFGIQIKNDFMKTKWRQYGVNSFILP